MRAELKFKALFEILHQGMGTQKYFCNIFENLFFIFLNFFFLKKLDIRQVLKF
jgi:hypothetical protein